MSLAQTRPAQREKRLPKYQAMAKVNGGWVRIGAAWEVRSGEDALSVQLTTVPVGAWDGRFSLFVPDPKNENEPPQD
jgi:hypothetical protein